jgi:hypothetical protein
MVATYSPKAENFATGRISLKESYRMLDYHTKYQESRQVVAGAAT